MSDEAQLIATAVRNWKPRFMVAGVDPNDLEQHILAKVATWREWYQAWCGLGAMHEALGDGAAATGKDVSAGEAYARAAVYYHFAQFTLVRYPELKREGGLKKVAVYRKAAPRLVPPAERLEIPFDGQYIPAYLRRPAGTASSPVVLLIPGADSVKEEFGTLEEVFLKRGMATLSMDGPGQGEARDRMLMIPDYERAISAVIDHLESRPGVDCRRVGACGISMGGTFAIRAAAHDARLKGVASVAGFYHVDYWERVGPLLRESIGYIYGVGTDEEARQKALLIDVREAVTRLKCPLLVIHGAQDRITPVEDARLIYDNASGEKDLVVCAEGNHVCNNIAYKYRPLAADWLRERLER